MSLAVLFRCYANFVRGKPESRDRPFLAHAQYPATSGESTLLKLHIHRPCENRAMELDRAIANYRGKSSASFCHEPAINTYPIWREWNHRTLRHQGLSHSAIVGLILSLQKAHIKSVPRIEARLPGFSMLVQHQTNNDTYIYILSFLIKKPKIISIINFSILKKKIKSKNPKF